MTSNEQGGWLSDLASRAESEFNCATAAADRCAIAGGHCQQGAIEGQAVGAEVSSLPLLVELEVEHTRVLEMVGNEIGEEKSPFGQCPIDAPAITVILVVERDIACGDQIKLFAQVRHRR